MRRRGGVALLAAAAVTMVACSDSPTTPGSDWAVDRLVLENTAMTASSLGEVVQLSARPLDRNGAPIMQIGLAWASSDSTVLRSEGNGRFRALRNGTALVTVGLATDPAFPTRTAQVVVRQQASRIDFTIDTLRLYAIGQAASVRARVVDALGNDVADATAPALSSTNPLIVSVDAAGTVTAKDDGDVAIAASTGGLNALLIARVKSTIRLSGCVTSANVSGASCRTVLLSTQAQR